MGRGRKLPVLTLTDEDRSQDAGIDPDEHSQPIRDETIAASLKHDQRRQVRRRDLPIRDETIAASLKHEDRIVAYLVAPPIRDETIAASLKLFQRSCDQLHSPVKAAD